MTTAQYTLAVQEAANYSDPDAYISDLLLSSAFLPPEDETAQPEMALMEPLRRIWMATAAPFRTLLQELGLGQSALARRYCIPLRTVQDWTAGRREAPAYVRLMLSQLGGYIAPPDD